tara:strand:- start:209 stop:424 length:216 start_codon:yes stop_codon:yes gene_type:complete
MVKMKLNNSEKCANPLDDCEIWLLKTFPKLKNKPLSIEVNQNGKINFIESPVNLTIGDMNKITDKYPELKT